MIAVTGATGAIGGRVARRLAERGAAQRLIVRDAARASRAPTGEPGWVIEGWVTTYAAVAAGELDVVTDTVERLAGHPPRPVPTIAGSARRTDQRSVREWLREHPESYAHLVA